MKRGIGKRGLSTVVATVLIIMLTVGAAAMIFAFVVPFIKNNLDKTEVCNNLREKILIGDRSCYNLTSTRIQIERETDINILGYRVSLASAGGDNSVFEIRNASVVDRVSMLTGSGSLILPLRGESKTYSFSLSADSASISPILEKNIDCGKISEVLPRCEDAR